MILSVKICETVLVRKLGTLHEKGRYFQSTFNMNGRPSEEFLKIEIQLLQSEATLVLNI